MLETQLDLVLSYCHYNLLNQRLNDVLAPAVKAKGLGLINASVTHMGLLTEQGPPPWHPAETAVKEASQRVAAYCRGRAVSLSALAVYFALQNPFVDVTLLGVSSEAELDSSLAVLSAPPASDVLAAVQAMLEPVINRSWKPD
jgi:L-galactose dehydrogenase